MSKHGIQMLSSLVALLGGGLLLIADSAEPECHAYEGFYARFDYETDCAVSRQTGWIDFAVPDLTFGTATIEADTEVDDWDLAAQEEMRATIISQALAGGLYIDAVPEFDTRACIGNEDETSVGRLTSIVLTLTEVQDDYKKLRCWSWQGNLDGPQNMRCGYDSQNPNTCSLKFFPVN